MVRVVGVVAVDVVVVLAVVKVVVLVVVVGGFFVCSCVRCSRRYSVRRRGVCGGRRCCR